MAMLALYSDVELLELELSVLISPDPLARKRTAALEIRAHVESAARELSLDRFAKFENELYKQIFSFIHSEKMNAKFGGILAIQQLIDCSSALAEQKQMKFASTLSFALKENSEFYLIQLVAETIGQMAKLSPVPAYIDYIENELNWALEGLRADTQHRRLAACAILQQLAENAPTVFFVRIRDFFLFIWDTLRDFNENIRTSAANALSACLAVLRQRTYHLQWYCAIYEQICIGLTEGNGDSIHGSLLVLREMLKHSGNFMIPRFKETCNSLMLLKDHRILSIRRAIILLIPELAVFARDIFARLYLEDAIALIVKSTKVVELRPASLTSVGRLCRAIGHHLVDRVEVLTAMVEGCLNGGDPQRKVKIILPETMSCISDMVIGLGDAFHPYLLSLLEALLQAGLSQQLIDTLTVVAAYVPDQRVGVQRRLLQEVTKVLGGTVDTVIPPSRYYGRWSKKVVLDVQDIKRAEPASEAPSLTDSIYQTLVNFLKNTQDSFDTSAEKKISQLNRHTDLVQLSLRTLGTLSAPSKILLPMIQESVLPYLNHADERIRKEAAGTCAHMLVLSSASTLARKRGPSALAIEGIISRLLETAVADPSTAVRASLLKRLTPEFDVLLGQVHHINTLMYLLSDENFEIREEAMRVMSRLASIDPGEVLPGFRQMLLNLISEIRNSSDSRLREESVLMLCNFLRAQPLQRVVRVFMGTIIFSLPFTTDVRLTTASLQALGELCVVMRQDIASFADHLLPIIVLSMQDQSSRRKQEVAIKTMGQFVSATGLVITPYLEYPQLLPSALDLVTKHGQTTPWSLRREALRTLGLLGALEPYKFTIIEKHIEVQMKKERSSSDAHTVMIIETMKQNKSKGLDQDGGDFGQAHSLGLSTTPRSRRYSGLNSLSFTPHTRRRTKTQEDLTRTRAGSDASGLMVNAKGLLIKSEVLLDEDNGVLPAHRFMLEQCAERACSAPSDPQKERITPQNDDFYPQSAIAALMRILHDSSLSVHHSSVAQAIMLIFKSLGMHCVPFLDEIIPFLLQVLRRCGPGLRESLLQQLSHLAAIVKYHLARYLPQLFEIICEFWGDNLPEVLSLVEEISGAAPDDFQAFVPRMLPFLLSSLTVPHRIQGSLPAPMMSILNTRSSSFSSSASSSAEEQELDLETGVVTSSILKPLEYTLASLINLRVLLRPHIHLVAPALCKLIVALEDVGSESLMWQSFCIRALQRVYSKGALLEYPFVASRIVHCLTRAIATASDRGVSHASLFYAECISALSALGRQLGLRFLTFDRLIRGTIENKKFSIQLYEDTIVGIKEGIFEQTVRLVPSQGKALKGSKADLNWLPKFASDIDLAGSYNFSQGGHLNQSSSVVWRNETMNANPIKLTLNQQQLQRAWDVTQRSTADDWNEWLKRLRIDLLRESPSPALRACSSLAQAHPPLARELFHAAFVSCWMDLSDTYQDSLVRALHTAFQSNTIPPEILQSLLNLAEFMEHDVEALPINPATLAELASKSHAYAKALHYRELQFQSSPSECFESLININKKLDQHDAALGILKVAQQYALKHNNTVTVHENWLAKLGYWQEALELYDLKLTGNAHDQAAIIGKLKCLDNLGRWEEAIELCSLSLSAPDSTISAEDSIQAAKIAETGANAAWSLNEWVLMDGFVSRMSVDSVEASLMKAVLLTNADEFDRAERLIDDTRRLLDESLTALVAESYSRAYFPLVMVQQCSELEEIIEYKKLLLEVTSYSRTLLGVDSSLIPSLVRTRSDLSNEEGVADADLNGTGQMLLVEAKQKKNSLCEKWRHRIQGCRSSGRASIPVWKSLLSVRRMVLNEREDLDTWLEFASLCGHGGNYKLAERILNISPGFKNRKSPISSLLESGNDVSEMSMDRRIQFAKLQQKWASNSNKKAAVKGLEKLLRAIVSSGDSSYLDADVHRDCLLKLGRWKLNMLEVGATVDPGTRSEVLELYGQATMVDPMSYRAWHEWGLSNYRAVEEARALHKVSGSSERQQHTIDSLSSFIINAAKGLLRAISLGTRRWSSSITQDMLSVLSIWFRYSRVENLIGTLEQCLLHVHGDTWLGVLPQLIARIDHPEPNARKLLHGLLSRLGAKHAQVLVYPLSVALKSPIEERQTVAESLINSLRQHFPALIDQFLVVSNELVRVAILWAEEWHECLEEASRQYYGEGNIIGMLETLTPMHRALNNGPTTMREASFVQAYGADLQEAHDLLTRYQQLMMEQHRMVPSSGGMPASKKKNNPLDATETCLAQAWVLYYAVFKRINQQLPTVTSLELELCSPALHSMQNIDLCVPGSYSLIDNAGVRIRSFGHVVNVIRSKQRPRKIKILGEDGLEYVFLLKGHEDLRQDERAMQLFGLVNALLYHDKRTENLDLSIRRYAVLPLSPSAGLISWVHNCDTLHDFIRDHRESRKIMLNVEHKLMQQLAPQALYDSLTMIQKLEVFESALANTAGEDLAKILWLRSENSEAWLQRRSTYTRSLAVMSMVGYVLGLGDRHPSNLMLDRSTGKVLHIDFGDCFEVAMQRDKFPERVPFRLTRMLVNAMEVSGIEGNFRLTCEKVMAILRENKDSVIATLEAFVHDPLVSWRLQDVAKIQTSRISADIVKKEVNINAPIPTSTGITNHDAIPEFLTRSAKETFPLEPVKSKESSLKVGGSVIPYPAGRVKGPVRIQPLPTLVEIEDCRDNYDDLDESTGGLVPSKSISRIVSSEGGDSPGLQEQPNILQEMQTMSSSLDGQLITFSLNQRQSFNEVSFANRRRAMTLSEDSVDQTADRSVIVIRRIQDKLTGLDFMNLPLVGRRANALALEVPEQVDKLIQQATSNENLCLSFFGWCPFW